MPGSRPEAFDAFKARLEGAPTSDVELMDLIPGQMVLDPAVKAHLLSYYANVAVEHSFTDDHDRIFDCVQIDRQPAARFVGQIAAPPLPDAPSDDLSALLDANPDLGGQCPDGLVAVKRLTLEDASRFSNLRSFLQLGGRKRKPPTPLAASEAPLMAGDYPHRYAVASQRIANLGGRSSMNLWKPSVTGQQLMSLSQIWISAGDGQSLQTAEAGWEVCDTNFQYANGQPVLFIYWTGDGYGSTGAYNNRDGKFVITSNAMSIGGMFTTTSSDGGAQYDLDLAYCFSGGNWWLYTGGVALGYWPAANYAGGALANGAQEVMVGGETDGNANYPPMGSGACPAAGYSHAAYHRNVVFYDAARQSQPAVLQGYAPTPAEYGVSIGQPAPAPGGNWESFFYFGGPGGA